MAFDPLEALLDGFRGEPGFAHVQVSEGFPGDAVRDEAVYAGEITSLTTYAAYSPTGRKHRMTDYTIPLEVRVASQHRADACRRRLVEIMEGIEGYVASDVAYAAEPLVTDHGIGETTSFVLGTPNGHLGMALLTVTVRTSIP